MSLNRAAFIWNRTCKLHGAIFPENQIISIKYEDICSNPISEMEKLCKFLNIDYEENMVLLKKSKKHLLRGSPS